MKTHIGGRQSGKSTRLIENMVEEHGSDLSECVILVPSQNWREHLLRIAWDLGVTKPPTVLPLPVFSIEAESVRELHRGREQGVDLYVYIDGLEHMVAATLGLSPSGVTLCTDYGRDHAAVAEAARKCSPEGAVQSYGS